MHALKLLCASLSLLAFATAAPAQSKKVDLGRVFRRWLSDFQAGRIDPSDAKGPERKPYLEPRPREQPSRMGWRGRGGRRRYSHLDEATELFRRLVIRGTAADGERLLRVIELSLGRKGGRLWEQDGRYSRFHAAVLRAIGEVERCPEAIQSVIVARLKVAFVAAQAGAPNHSPDAASSQATAKKHAEPELASVLIPLVAGFGRPGNRYILEDCLLVEDSAMKTAAAEALARMGFGRSITAVARALATTECPEDIGRFARSIEKLFEAPQPPPNSWRESVGDSFVLAPEKRPVERHDPDRTVVASFFGILVTGNHVVFVVDISMSMAWPFERITVPRGGRRRGVGGGRGFRPPPGGLLDQAGSLQKGAPESARRHAPRLEVRRRAVPRLGEELAEEARLGQQGQREEDPVLSGQVPGFGRDDAP